MPDPTEDKPTGDRLPWVDEAGLAKQHPRIFHYTRVPTLRSILSSGGLLATPFNNTNDTVEFTALREPLVEEMFRRAVPLIKSGMDSGRIVIDISDEELLRVARNNANEFYQIMIEALPSVPHLLCFCAHDLPHQRQNGILTMWRLYGGQTGVALGFDTAKLVSITERIQKQQGIELIYLDKVGYGLDDPSVRARVDAATNVPSIYAKAVLTLLERNEELPPTDHDDFLKFIVLNGCVKHADFQDEREIRLIVSEASGESLCGRTLPTKIRKRMLVECLDALVEVVVGPATRQDAIAHRVEKTLREFDRADVDVRRSTTPFRAAN